MSETKRFHLGELLCVTTDRLVSLDGIGGVYAILNWMTNDSLYTHQLPRASEECEPWLRRWFPWLNEIVVPAEQADAETKWDWRSWLNEQVAKYGAHHEVPRIPRDDHAHREPVAELQAMLRPDQTLIVLRSDKTPDDS